MFIRKSIKFYYNYKIKLRHLIAFIAIAYIN